MAFGFASITSIGMEYKQRTIFVLPSIVQVNPLFNWMFVAIAGIDIDFTNRWVGTLLHKMQWAEDLPYLCESTITNGCDI